MLMILLVFANSRKNFFMPSTGSFALLIFCSIAFDDFSPNRSNARENNSFFASKEMIKTSSIKVHA